MIRELYKTEDIQRTFKRLDAKVELLVSDIYLIKLHLGRNHVNNLRPEDVLQQLDLVDTITMTFDSEDFLIYRTEYLLTRYETLRVLGKRPNRKTF